MGFGRSNRYDRHESARRRAVAETSAFLTWALAGNKPLPRIPRRRVDRGGFSDMIRRPLAGKLVLHWWAQTLDRIRDF